MTMRKNRSWNRRVWLVGLVVLVHAAAAGAGEAPGWVALFDGKSLNGWKASENAGTWSVRDGCLVAQGPRSHLYYTGPAGGGQFKNFELEIEAKTQPGANSGVFFHTAYEAKGWPSKGYEVQINNTQAGRKGYRELKRTGSLYAVRNIAKSFVKDGQSFRMRICVVGSRVRIHVNDHLTVDYIQPPKPGRTPNRAGRILSRGTIALQGHDAKSVVSFRRIAIRLLGDKTDSAKPKRASDKGYGLSENLMDRVAGSYLPFVDYHVHLRGGMTVSKAIARQAVTGINIGVLRNIGKGWPIETDAQLATFLDSVSDRPVFVGLQVNDRGWHKTHSQKLLRRLDFVLGDTMIMPMPNDDSPPVKLWQSKQYTIDDPEAWMKRYVKHNLRVLAEPITILANPTYLPPAVKDRYDKLWTDARMKQVIQAAIDNHVALEINAQSGLPHERFIRLAKKMGAKFTFGTNNFKDNAIDMSRCFKAIKKYGLAKKDMYVPEPKQPRTK
jgi:hypothetical protein